MENTRLFEMADRLKALKKEKKEFEDVVKQLTADIETLDRELSDAMAEEEVERFSRNGSTFYLNTRLYASPAAGGKENLFAALRENGYGDIITENVNVNTLASFVKEQIAENDGELPVWLGECVNTYEKVTVGIRKA